MKPLVAMPPCPLIAGWRPDAPPARGHERLDVIRALRAAMNEDLRQKSSRRGRRRNGHYCAVAEGEGW